MIDSRIVELLPRGRRIVDVGCGSGEILDGLANHFVERIGIDASRRRLARRDEKVEWQFIQADVNLGLPCDDNSCDAVICNQVIEHIIDPVKYCQELFRILKPGGTCVITTPNVRYIKVIFDLVIGGYGPRTAGGNTIDGDWDDGHVHYFSHRDLRELFLRRGFRQIRSKALIRDPKSNLARNLLDKLSETVLVREFLSGCILLWAVK